MRLRLLAGAVLLLAVGEACSCVGLAVGGDAGSGEPDGGSSSFGGPPVTIHGTAIASLCAGAPGATVQVVDGTDAPVTADATGHFDVTVPTRSALLVTRPGAVPTMTFGHTFADGQTSVQAGSVPSDFSLLFHGLASFQLTAAIGTVVVGVMDEAPLPVTDAVVSLLDLEGTAVAANARLRYASFDGTLIHFDAGTGTGNTGIAAVFQVPPGLYLLHIERAGYIFADALVPVAGGTVTADMVHGVGTGGTAALPFTGTVQGFLPFPMAPGTEGPLSGYGVTLTLDDGTTFDTTTDGNGAYSFSMPAVGHWFDVTASSPGYGPLRSEQKCSGQDVSLRFTVGDRYQTDQALCYFLGDVARAPDSGVLGGQVVRGAAGTTGVAGAVVSTEPPLPSPFYGPDPAGVYSCAVTTCLDGGSCPAGTRCEDGECRLGTTGPLCEVCDAGTCPAGFQPMGSLPLDGGPGICSCLPSTAGCDPAVPSCPHGTYCSSYTVPADGGGLEIGGSACLLYVPPASSTIINQGGPVGATFTNVTPGLYVISAQVDGGAVPPIRVRVSPGVETSATLFAP